MMRGRRSDAGRATLEADLSQVLLALRPGDEATYGEVAGLSRR